MQSTAMQSKATAMHATAMRLSSGGIALRASPLLRSAVRPAASRAVKRVQASAGRDEPPKNNKPAAEIAGIASLVGPWLLAAGPAHAIGREYGVLEGQIASLIHPATMFFLFGASVYAGYLGLQWRHTRDLANEIKALKAQRPPARVGPDGQALPAEPSPLDAQISELEKERKELIGKKLNEKHNNWGSLLLGLGVTMSVGGPVNTFLRTGKLFPGPHLWAGAAITVLWALAASLVPQMQKGNETARSLHIALNTVNVLLFAWQIPTGLEIVAKVFEFTTLP